MKVVHRGKPSGETVYRGTCHNCKSIMEEKAAKLKIEHDQREQCTFAHAECPVCRRDFVLYPKSSTM